MDKLEFRKRVYADPDNLDQDILDAAAADPDFQRIVDQTRSFNAELAELIDRTSAPEGLKSRLLALPEQASAEPGSSDELAAKRASHAAANSGNEDSAGSNNPNRLRRYYAIAACLLVAVGLSIALPVNRGPSAEEMAMGNEVIAHIYHESDELAAIATGTLRNNVPMTSVSDVMAHSGSRLNSDNVFQNMPVRYANPCEISPAFQSSHLILEGNAGAINVITLNNSPVSREFSIGDDRFSGIVIPMGSGNLILVTEKNQDPAAYRAMIEDNLEWAI